MKMGARAGFGKKMFTNHQEGNTIILGGEGAHAEQAGSQSDHVVGKFGPYDGERGRDFGQENRMMDVL